jgi:hypothetical protein
VHYAYNNATIYVHIVEFDFSCSFFVTKRIVCRLYSKKKMKRPSEEYWEDLVGYWYIYDYYGITQIVNLNGTYITATNVEYSNRSIKFSAIYFSPYDSSWDDYDAPRRIAIIAHELGHSLTLGHSNADYLPAYLRSSDTSIMRQYTDNMSNIPQPHDRTDLTSKYPSP